MRLLYQLRHLVGAIPRAAVRRQARQFHAATRNCRETQAAVLSRLLALNADSEFSTRHGLHRIRTVDEFQHAMPVTEYEHYRPYIERVKTGDHRALLGTANRLLMFSLSSGTTSESKFIPITQQFLDDYRQGWQVWGIHVLDDYPAISSRKILQFSGDYDRFRTQSGIPCGNISGLVAAMQKRIVRTMYTVPGIVSKIEDPAARNYAALRLGLADPDVALVTTANPSTLIHLAKLGNAEKERLIRDIANGTLSSHVDIPAEIRRQLRFRLGSRRARARQLDHIVDETGSLYPKHYWPDLSLVAVWSGGSAGAFLPTLRRYYGDVPLRDHGLSASEGRMTIPLRDNRSSGVLDIATHFFEFIPVEERGADNPVVLQSHELEPGQTYFILLTTASGLYRYDICDVVRCTGYTGTTPLLEFLHKGANIANLTGEKVSESQVVSAVRETIEELHAPLEQFTVSPSWGEPPWYQLLTEPLEGTLHGLGVQFARRVDFRLQQINCEYRDKRSTGRLGPLQWVPVPASIWQSFAWQRQQGLGGSQEQYKHPCLVPELNFAKKLLQDYRVGAA